VIPTLAIGVWVRSELVCLVLLTAAHCGSLWLTVAHCGSILTGAQRAYYSPFSLTVRVLRAVCRLLPTIADVPASDPSGTSCSCALHHLWCDTVPGFTASDIDRCRENAKNKVAKYPQNHITVSQGSDLAISWRSISTDLRNSESGAARLGT
jgi:hypothetical protein